MESIKKQLKDSLDSMGATYEFTHFRSAIRLLITSDHTREDIDTLKGLCDGYSIERLSCGNVGSLIFNESIILISTKESDDKLFTPLSYDSTSISISISATELLTTNDK